MDWFIIVYWVQRILCLTNSLLSLMKVYYRSHYKKIYVRDGTGTSARRTNGVGNEVDCVWAGFTNGSRIRASETVGIKAVGYGGLEITCGTKRNAKSLEQIHWRTASGARRGIVCNEGATAGTADAMGHVIRGVKCDEDGSRLQAD